MTPWRLGALAAVAAGLGYALAVAPVPFYDKGEPREALVVRALLAGLRPLARVATPRPFAERVRASVVADATLCAAGWVDYAVRYYVARPLLHCPADARPHFAVRATTRAPAPGCVDTGVADERRIGRGLRFALDACGGPR